MSLPTTTSLGWRVEGLWIIQKDGVPWRENQKKEKEERKENGERVQEGERLLCGRERSGTRPKKEKGEEVREPHRDPLWVAMG